MKNVLVACEESQTVCKAFRDLGVIAYSCDLQPCSGGYKEWHIQDDIRYVLFAYHWDCVIAHPPCTYLTVTGNRWFNEEKYGSKARLRMLQREKAVAFFNLFVNCSVPCVCIENPVGIMSTRYRKPDQIIQPYQFGDPFEKRTCLWLKNLPLLSPTNIVVPEPRIVFPSGKSMPGWYASCWNLSSSERSRVRSKTFPGIARAMAEQWSKLEVLH